MVFYRKYLQLSYSSLKTSKEFFLIFFSSSPFCSLELSPLLNHPKSHHFNPKQQESKIQNNKVPQLIPILIALFTSNHTLSLPP